MAGEKKRANPAKKGYHPTQREHSVQNAAAVAKGARRGWCPPFTSENKKADTHGCLLLFGAVWHNLYEPVLEEIAVLSAVSISFSVFTTCSFVSFRCSGLSVKL